MPLFRTIDLVSLFTHATLTNTSTLVKHNNRALSVLVHRHLNPLLGALLRALYDHSFIRAPTAPKSGSNIGIYNEWVRRVGFRFS